MPAVLERVDRGLVDDLNRRRFLTAAGATALGLGLAGCGSGSTGAAPSGASAAGFPVTVQGKFGPTVVEAPPTRVLTLGNGPDADTVRALGVRPVAMIRRTSFPDGVPPWPPVAPGEPPIDLIRTADGLPFEQIAALRPDLIVATTQYTLDRDHEQLARIAPVLAYVDSPNTDRWEDSTVRIGQVLGKRPQAEKLVADTQARIVAAKNSHPNLAGRTFTFGPVIADGQVYTINTPQDLSAVFLRQLGLVLSPRVQSLPTSGTRGKAVLADEQIGVLDADLLLLSYPVTDPAIRQRLEADPVFRQIPAVRRGSYVALDVPSSLAMAFPSTLALAYALDHVVAPLAKAVR